MMKQCLYCYREISGEERNTPAGKGGFHTLCSKKIFGNAVPAELPYSEDDMIKLAEKIVKSQKTVTGVQPKLSLGINKIKGSQKPDRFTIVGLWGEYILKLPTITFPNLPELEDLTMHLAGIAGIKTVNHSLIYLRSGHLAYITKRIDRIKGRKLHMEDMCQLTERLTEHKYLGSYEQIAKTILKYSAYPGLDVINFYEQVVFSFLTGNNDMHLKNFSLLKDKSKLYHLSQAYDLVASALVLEEDDEELALTLNGKKKKVKRVDFEAAMRKAYMEDKVINNVLEKFIKVLPGWHDFIEISFIPDGLKASYHEMIEKRKRQLGLN